MKFKAIAHQAKEGGYWAEVPALPGCITEGGTWEELMANLKDAIEGWLAVPEVLNCTLRRRSPDNFASCAYIKTYF
jgi:predicted RNase H-like HicB family nuclease